MAVFKNPRLLLEGTNSACRGLAVAATAASRVRFGSKLFRGSGVVSVYGWGSDYALAERRPGPSLVVVIFFSCA